MTAKPSFKERGINRKGLSLAVFIIGLASVQVFAQVRNYVQLYRYLVELPGWKASKPTGMNMSGPMGRMVTASREYESGTKSLTAQIVSGTQAQGAWAPFSTGMTFDTPGAFSKVTEMRDHQVGITHDKNENSGSIVVSLKGKIFAVFVLGYEGMPYKDAMAIAQKFPWKYMEEAFK